MKAVAHIINHTHWDREWFLTSVYTNPWIPGLVDALECLVRDNPDYQFLLDGQTLVIEDLLKLAPGYRDKVDRLIQGGNLIIGPYYCQPDWRITGGESLIRNLLYGRQDMEQHGGHNRAGWLVDTFGHISQAPQLHRMFGLETTFVWRGVPQLDPFFFWQGADSSQLLTMHLIGGYRNLYGITQTPEIAVKRLETEVAKLRPYYPTADIPLFDGYDLEQNPEDPVRFYQEHAVAIPQYLHIRGSAPGDFAETISDRLERLPVIRGELNSGKYGATFPGTLSSRTYLKVMHCDCEHLLFKLAEPLAVLARLKGRAYNAQQYESWGRMLLQNVWRVAQRAPVERPNQSVGEFRWQNDHYTAFVGADGAVRTGAAKLGYLVITEEKGDTYSEETGRRLGICRAAGPLVIEEKSVGHCVVRYDCAYQGGKAHIWATVRLTFDQTPLLRWQVDLDSRGTGFRVDMAFATAHPGEVYAAMPFDVVKRPTADTDLLPRQLPSQLAAVLLGQRELGQVRTFPFHDFVTISDESSSAVVMAKGIRAYQADDDGTISLTLRRSVEWLTASDLQCRSGDAGPFMYVPDARCERTVRHRIAVAVVGATVDDMALHEWNAGFQNPPLVIAADGQGKQTGWRFLQEALPLSSLSFDHDKLLARFYNPTSKEYPLSKTYQVTDVRGNPKDSIETVPAKAIVTLEVETELPPVSAAPATQRATVMAFPMWRVGENRGLPDPDTIGGLEAKIAELELQLERVEEQLTGATGDDRLLLQHRYYVLAREQYELRLSALLNRRKLARQGRLDDEYLTTPDPEIARLGAQLNELRIKRRIYDYVIEVVSRQPGCTQGRLTS